MVEGPGALVLMTTKAPVLGSDRRWRDFRNVELRKKEK